MKGDGGLYVYAIADAGLPQRLRLEGHRLETLTAAGIGVVVERVASTPPLTEDALRVQHEIVLRLAERSDAILPARFGTHMSSETQLRKVIARAAAPLRRALTTVRGHRQMTVRVLGAAAAPAEGPARAPSGTAYLARRRQHARTLPAELAAVHDALGTFASEMRFDPPRGMSRGTLFHLIPAAVVDDYLHVAVELQSSLRPLFVRVSGPWPPFAFAPELLDEARA